MCVFFRSSSSYSFETCTTVIITPENLRVNWIWYSKYKRKWCFRPKCVFSEMDHHTALKLVPLWSSDLKTSECTEFGPLNTKKSDVFSEIIPNLCHCDHQTFRVNWIWYSKSIQWCFRPKCVFSEMDHHTALKLVPLWSSHLKTSECTKFGPLNTKKSDMLTQNVFFLRNGSSYSFETCTIVIITPENLRVNWVWYSKYKEKGCFSPKLVPLFLRNGSSYSFETCTIVIIRPENLRVHWVWPSKYKEKWYVNPKCVFLRNGSSYSFETCTIVIITPENLRVH